MATSYSPITQQQFLHILLQEEKIAVASLQMTETQLLNYKHSHIDAHPSPLPEKKRGWVPRKSHLVGGGEQWIEMQLREPESNG